MLGVWLAENATGSNFTLEMAAQGQRLLCQHGYEKAKAAGQLLISDAGEVFRLELPNNLGAATVTRAPDGSFSFNSKDVIDLLHLEGGEQE